MTIYANNYGLHSRICKNTSVITILSRSACTQSSQAKGNMAPRHFIHPESQHSGSLQLVLKQSMLGTRQQYALASGSFPHSNRLGYLQVKELGNLSPFLPIFPLQEKKEHKTRRYGNYKRPSKRECETKKVSIWCVAACGVEMVGHYTKVKYFYNSHLSLITQKNLLILVDHEIIPHFMIPPPVLAPLHLGM